MNIEVRIYKRWDLDILALLDAGYPVAMMMRDVIINFANGNPCFYYIDEQISFNPNGKNTRHTRIIIPNSEHKACYLLRNIEKGYKNSFVKMLFRNSLVAQNLNIYFTDKSLCNLTNMSVIQKNIQTLSNVIPLSQIRQNENLLNVLEKNKGNGVPQAPAMPIYNMSMVAPVYTPQSVASPVPAVPVMPQIPVQAMPQQVTVQQVQQPVQQPVQQTVVQQQPPPATQAYNAPKDNVGNAPLQPESSSPPVVESSDFVSNSHREDTGGPIEKANNDRLLKMFDNL